MSIEKLNLRLVRASEYMALFDLYVRHKPGKDHLVPDALSRLPASGSPHPLEAKGELDALHTEPYAFIALTVQMSNTFKRKILKGYAEDSMWTRTLTTVKANAALGQNAASLPFELQDGLLFRIDAQDSPPRLCIPPNCLQDIFEPLHRNNHIGYAKMHALIISSFYIWRLKHHLRAYLLHCPECLVFQTRRHAPYGSLQPIETPPCPYHTITIDFVLGLPTSAEGYNCLLTLTDKYSKKIALIPGKDTYTATD
ncbi:MAG: integrase zinc binding domain-containing protein [Candidatus Micrarchaeaceae archaeon]